MTFIIERDVFGPAHFAGFLPHISKIRGAPICAGNHDRGELMKHNNLISRVIVTCYTLFRCPVS
jgi:hypothetical protein